MATVTDLLLDPRGYDAAEAAARSAAIEIRTLSTMSELEEVRSLYQHIWQTTDKNSPVPTDMLRAMAKAGSYVSGAFDHGELVGACFGFFWSPASNTLHSHLAGVLKRMRGRNVGFALKLHQRAWAMEQGVDEISWTYDPLVRRNAYFNISKLAADVNEYLPNFYGLIDDGINRADDTDRILIKWRLSEPDAVAACALQPRLIDARAIRAAGADTALGISDSGDPVAGRADTRTVLVAVPSNIENLRESDPERAKRWRSAVRDALGGLLEDGARVRGFDRAGWYIVDKQETK